MVVLGSGGAARALAYGAVNQGVDKVVLKATSCFLPLPFVERGKGEEA